MRGGYQTYVLDYHPFDVVGWDGYLYPWTFSIHDFEPITGRIHQPPPSHQTFAGPELRDLLVLPAQARLRPARGADSVPPLEPAVGGDDLLRLRQVRLAAAASTSARSRCIPSGLPHGPQPGLAEKSIGTHETHELAVMCDTFHPLKLTKFAKDLDDGKYAYSWYENARGRGRCGRGVGRTARATPAAPASRRTSRSAWWIWRLIAWLVFTLMQRRVALAGDRRPRTMQRSRLREHYAGGYLTLDEFSRRTGSLSARSRQTDASRALRPPRLIVGGLGA